MKRTIHFVDNGQDFLEWDIDRNGVVIGCRPCQASIWNGTKVLNPVIEVCSLLDILCNDGEQRTLAHRVVKVVHRPCGYTVESLINTSVDDCKCSLQSVTDMDLLQQLWSRCIEYGHVTRGQHVLSRVKKLRKLQAVPS